MRYFLALGLMLGFIGCAQSAIQPLRSWQSEPTSAADTISIRTKAESATGDQSYTLHLVCRTSATSDDQLSLIVNIDKAAFTAHPGTVRFGQANPIATDWHIHATNAKAGVSSSRLAEGAASVFRSHRQVALMGLPGQRAPVIFTVGQGPYEPVVSNFLAHCPSTGKRLPKLVRIRNSVIKPVPHDGSLGQPINMRPPNYPSEAIQRGQQGLVKVAAAITPEGKVLWPVITQSSGYSRLDLATLKAISQWRYEPHGLADDELYLMHRDITFRLPKR